VILRKIHLQSFRNYKDQQINFGNGINILYGNNAQGKTNVIEAVHLLSTGKSHRTNHYQDMIAYDGPGFILDAAVVDDEACRTIYLSYQNKTGKILKINDVRRDRWSDLLGLTSVVLFSPETMDIVKKSPSERRKFINILLCQLNRTYLRELQHYTSLISNKSTALRDRKNFTKFKDMLPVWNEAIAKSAAFITGERQKIVMKLSKKMNVEMQIISNYSEKVTLSLKTQVDHEKPLLSQWNDLLSKGTQKEIEQGQCLYGPHRDEMDILLNGQTAKTYCSQGQQRSIALSMILGAMHIYKDETDSSPILLLDDVMSELDTSRQDYLISSLENTQTIITTTDQRYYRNKISLDTKYMKVEHGQIVEG
jgi:DNA replication and repair protein RecF